MKKSDYIDILNKDERYHRAYAISKHNREDPIYGDEWSSIDDVGLVFPSGVLTLALFCEVEQQYIHSAQEILGSCKCDCLYLVYSELYSRRSRKNQDDLFRLNKRIRISELPFYIRGMMRDEFFVVLVNPHKGIRLDFGYDIYMRLSCPLELEEVQQIANRNGLFLNMDFKGFGQ